MLQCVNQPAGNGVERLGSFDVPRSGVDAIQVHNSHQLAAQIDWQQDGFSGNFLTREPIRKQRVRTG